MRLAWRPRTENRFAGQAWRRQSAPRCPESRRRPDTKTASAPTRQSRPHRRGWSPSLGQSHLHATRCRAARRLWLLLIQPSHRRPPIAGPSPGASHPNPHGARQSHRPEPAPPVCRARHAGRPKTLEPKARLPPSAFCHARPLCLQYANWDRLKRAGSAESRGGTCLSRATVRPDRPTATSYHLGRLPIQRPAPAGRPPLSGPTINGRQNAPVVLAYIHIGIPDQS